MKAKTVKTIVKFSLFLLIANLPFLTMTHVLGIDTFLDSFQHPESYQYLKSDKINLPEKKGEYLVLEKPTHVNYALSKGDNILYYAEDGALQCRSILQVHLHQGIKTYYTTTVQEDDLNGPIYDYQIIGKVTGVIEDNIWTSLSLQVWDLSIDNLNAVALLTNT
jgi:hypothetical protein